MLYKKPSLLRIKGKVGQKMEAYRIQTKLVSEIIKLPQITKWIGQEVEIIILPIKEVETSILQKINSLVGTVLM